MFCVKKSNFVDYIVKNDKSIIFDQLKVHNFFRQRNFATFPFYCAMQFVFQSKIILLGYHPSGVPQPCGLLCYLERCGRSVTFSTFTLIYSYIIIKSYIPIIATKMQHG